MLQIHTNDECAILINACDAMIITLESIVLVLMIRYPGWKKLKMGFIYKSAPLFYVANLDAGISIFTKVCSYSC